MNDKKVITKIIIDQLPQDYFGTENLDKIIFKIWCTGRTGTGLRLTEEGHKAFSDADIAYYEYPLDLDKIGFERKDLTNLTLKLDREIKCPFYLGLKNKSYKTAYIRVYDSKTAMMISLIGSVADYIKMK